MKNNDRQELVVGQYSVRLDSHGRVRLPAGWRPLLRHSPSSQIVLLPVEGTHLVIPSEQALQTEHLCLQQWQERSKSGKRATRTKMARLRHMLEAAVYVQMGSDGRFTIPKELRRYAGLKREAVFVGGFNFAEIWFPARYAKLQARSFNHFIASCGF